MKPETQFHLINQYVKTALVNESKYGGFIPKETAEELHSEMIDLINETDIEETIGLKLIEFTMEGLEKFIKN